MLFFLGKCIQPFLYPFNISLALLLAGTLLLWKNYKPKLSRILITGGLALLVFTSIPALTYPLFFSLEKEFPAKKFEDYPKADAIVVLGGTVPSVVAPRADAEETNGSRVVPAFQIWKLKKAPLIVVSSGAYYPISNHQMRTEAEDMKALLVSLGVPSEQIVLESSARNTFESAVYVSDWARQAEKKSILLVTSAFHMARSVFLFQKTGLEVIPVPTDYKVTSNIVEEYLPSSDGISRLNGFIKEKIGLYAYKWIDPFKK